MMVNPISGYGNEAGITLHFLGETVGDSTAINIVRYEPDDIDFAFAVQQLDALNNSEPS